MNHKSNLQLALENMKEEGYDFDVRDYSGRGMFGKTCLAITGDLDPNEVCFHLGQSEEMKGKHLPASRLDNMGLGKVMYWPGVDYVEEKEKVE